MKAKMIKKAAKGLLLSSVLFCSLHGNAQQKRAVLSDPKLGSISLTDLSGWQLNEAYVQPNELIKIKIPVMNSNHGEALPAGSCKIKIGLGSKLLLDTSYDLNSSAMSSYFRWSAAMNSGQVQITGELAAPLPANVNDVEVAFKIKGTALGKSTITANFLVSNHNTRTVVSDEDGTNNTAFLHYTVSDKPAPVSVTTINEIVKEGCSMNVTFSTDQEINLSRYEIEVSKDAVTFEKVAAVSAAGNLSYSSSFELPAALQVKKLLVRIKAVMVNGRMLYSETKNVNGICNKTVVKLSLYPNPVSGISKVTINAVAGIFDGKYRLKMTDMAGKTVVVKDVSLNGVQNFVFDFGNIAGGKYLIQVSDAQNVVLGVLQLEKL